MYLSKLTLDPRHPQARRDLGDPYQMHQTLVRAFAPGPDAPPHPFLWRQERTLHGLPPSDVLIQSATPADWSHLEQHSGYTLQIQGNKPIDLQQLLQPERRCRFRLLANPTVTRNGKRLGLLREEEQLAWLERQGERNGFAVKGCIRDSDGAIRVRQGKTGHRITLHAALFEGILEVTEPQQLQEATLKGLGHGKAFGLGMLSLAPMS